MRQTKFTVPEVHHLGALCVTVNLNGRKSKCRVRLKSKSRSRTVLTGGVFFLCFCYQSVGYKIYILLLPREVKIYSSRVAAPWLSLLVKTRSDNQGAPTLDE